MLETTAPVLVSMFSKTRHWRVWWTPFYLGRGGCSFASKKDRAIHMAGGLGLVPIMLHDIREILLKRLPRHLQIVVD